MPALRNAMAAASPPIPPPNEGRLDHVLESKRLENGPKIVPPMPVMRLRVPLGSPAGQGDFMYFRQLDLNLLVALYALLDEKSIRAGKRVHLTSPP